MNPNPAPFFGRKISQVGVNVTQATDNQLVLKEDYNLGNTIYYDGSGIATVLIGLRPLTGIRGFYVAQPGIDVRVATDEQLIFNSQNDIFKIVETGSGIIPGITTSTGEFNSILIPHNLGFVPIADVYVQMTFAFLIDNADVFVPSYTLLPVDNKFYLLEVPSINSTIQIYSAVDINNLYIGWQYDTHGDSGVTFDPVPYKYYLRQETAN